MSSHYDPIPTDSDGEDEHVSDSVHMSGDDARSDRTRSTDRSNFLQPRAMATDSEPEEDDPASADHRAPMSTADSEVRPPIRQTARMSVRMPEPQQWTRSRSPTPPTDPYIRPFPGFHIWERTLNTLQEWRSKRQYTPIPSGEGSSSGVRQEFLLDTTPIIVDRMVEQENRLDIIEDSLMEMPGGDVFDNLQEQVNDIDARASRDRNLIRNMEQKVEELNRKCKSMESSIQRMERLVDDCHAMTAMAQGTTTDNLREFFNKKWP